MAITRAQQYRQMLENGGRGISLQEAKAMAPKGEFLAYINKKEAKMLKDAGGSGIMTNAGIPSYRFGDERDNAGFDAGRNADNFGGGGDDEPNPGDRDTFNPETGRENSSGGPGPRGDNGFSQRSDERQREKARVERARIAEIERAEKARIAQELFEEREKKRKADLSKSKTTKFGTPIVKPKITKSNFKNPNIFEQYLNNNLLTKGLNKLTNSDFAYGLNEIQREKFLEELKEDDPARYSEVMKDLTTMGYVTSGVGPLDIRRNIKPTFTDLGEPQAKAILEGGRKVNVNPNNPDDYDLSTDYTDYLNRFDSDNTGGGGGEENNPILPIIPETTDPVTDPVVDPRANFYGLAPRFAGSIFDFSGLADGGIARAGAMDGGRMMMMANQEEDDPTGGIMDLESGRQMYFLGKLVKKATRAVKKIVKSPIGKAALLGGAMYFGGGGKGLSSFFGKGSFNPFLRKVAGDTAFSGLGDIASKFGMINSKGAMTLGGKLGLGFGIPFALDALGVGKEEEDNSAYEKYMKDMKLDIPALRGRRNLAAAFDGSTYNYEDYADGGRIGYQEGSKEPVAKETMPLLDMDGQEMDLREDGGFVPLGRMERADDVPARLSKNEFVFTADAVRNAGEGDIDKGAEVMYNMMKNLESGGDVSEESQGLDGAREMFKTSQRLEEVL